MATQKLISGARRRTCRADWANLSIGANARIVSPPCRLFFGWLILWSSTDQTIFVAAADPFERDDGKACRGCATKPGQRWLAPIGHAQSGAEDLKMILAAARRNPRTRRLGGRPLLPLRCRCRP